MTPQEQIAYVRARIDTFETVESNAAILVVCDLAERALAFEVAAQAVLDWWDDDEIDHDPGNDAPVAVLRRLLGDA